PASAALTLTRDAAGPPSGSDRGRADQLLVPAATQVRTLIEDIRTLIYGLRPPALDELGLAASIRALADRDATSGLRVEVEVPSALPEFPAAGEVAAYWIGQGALTDVGKTSRARAGSIQRALRPAPLPIPA